MSVISFDWRLFEKVGFSTEQTNVIKKAIETNSHQTDTIKHEIDACESRFEKAMKEMELRLVKEINTNTERVIERIHKIEINLSFINRIGSFILGAASLAAIFTSIFHLQVHFN